MPDTYVRHFMSQVVETIGPDRPVVDVVRRMRDCRVSCVVVCDEHGPVGIVSERDLCRLCVDALTGTPPKTVSDIMSDRLITTSSDASCKDTVSLFRERAIRRAVVVDDDGVLCGVITQSDLLRAHAREIEIQRDMLETLARVDPLLRIGNRRAMIAELEKLEQRAARYGRTYAAALVDVDNFKNFNDCYGHQGGDEALQLTARTIGESIRVADTVYRYGGEEFLVTFPEINVDGAAIAAEHIRRAVEALQCPHAASPFGQVTVSIGVAEENPDAPCWSSVISRADEALYEAKNNGRNRVQRSGLLGCHDPQPGNSAACGSRDGNGRAVV